MAYAKETICIQSGWKPKNGEPRVLPIYQSTTFKYESSEQMGRLFDLEESGYFYSRLANPTNDCVAQKICELEGGAAAMLTGSGQAANYYAVFNICEAGDHVVLSSTVYGGTFNLLAVTMKKMGVSCTVVDPDADYDTICKVFQPNTKCVMAESLANPALVVLDFEKFARAAHAHHVPLIVDNTFPTPINCNPFKWGVDIVTHSTTKYMDGHATQLGGVIVDSGNFDWTNGNFPEFTEPDQSYHGVVYTRDFGRAAYITKARVQLMRDLGCYPSAQAAFLLNHGLETLHLRMERHCQNAEQVARFLQQHGKVESVNYPTLAENPYHQLAQKYLPNGCSGVISFSLTGGREAAVRFIDSLKLASLVVHVADVRTLALHPASSTHRQLTDEQLVAAGIHPGMIRLSVGIEHVDDIIEDLKQALEQA